MLMVSPKIECKGLEERQEAAFAKVFWKVGFDLPKEMGFGRGILLCGFPLSRWVQFGDQDSCLVCREMPTSWGCLAGQ